MKKYIAGFTVAVMVLTVAAPAFALSQSEAKNVWIQAQQTRKSADEAYREAQLDYKQDVSSENEQALIDASKTVMNDALDEVEAWLNWKNIEANEDARVPSKIKDDIAADVAMNLQKIEGFRTDVAGVKTRLQAVGVFLKLVGGYVGLMTDVARNTGAMWVSIGDQLTTKAETFESKLRATAINRPELIEKLDLAKAEIDLAKNKVSLAKATYLLVKLPGTPFAKFGEGNRYLNEARVNLVQAQAQMLNVFNSLTTK